MTKTRRVLAIALVALMLLSICPVFWATALAAQTVDLSLVPASQSLNVSDTFTVDVVVQPNGQQVFGVDALVDFDPAYLEVTQMAGAASSPFSLELNKTFDNTAGHADYSAGTLSPPPTTSAITLATITFRAKAATTSTALVFSLAAPRHSDVGFVGQSVLRNAIGAAVAITGTQPAAAFTADVTSGVRPLTVNFTDASTGSPSAWSWTFGDGGTSSQRNANHTYNGSGIYNVTLTITAGGTQYSLTRNGYITVLDPTPTPLPTATPANTPPPTVIVGPPTATATPAATNTPIPGGTVVATPTPTPVPGAGGISFVSVLPWVFGIGATLLVCGIMLRRGRRTS